MNMSFQEKSIWISLTATLLIFGGYFANAFRVLADPEAPAIQLLPLFIGAVVMFIIVEIVTHIVLAIAFHREAQAGEDERDRLIELKATRLSYFVLAAGVWTTGVGILIWRSPAIAATVLMFSFILAEVVGYSFQLFYYRRGL